MGAVGRGGKYRPCTVESLALNQAMMMRSLIGKWIMKDQVRNSVQLKITGLGKK